MVLEMVKKCWRAWHANTGCGFRYAVVKVCHEVWIFSVPTLT